MKKISLLIALLLLLGSIKQARCQSNLSDSLIACFLFNGNANDNSGHNNNGTVFGATLTADRNGMPNSAYQFDGISNYIDVPTLTNKLTGGEFSISFWGYTDVTIAGFAILLTADDPSNRFCISIFYPLHNSSPPLNTIFDYGDIANNGRLNSYTSPPTGVWSHFTMVCSKTQQKMRYYLNGVLTDSAYFNSDITPVAGRTLQIGGGYGSNGNPYYFEGKLDDIKMFNRAINGKEVIELYHDSLNGGPVVKKDTINLSDSLIACFQFNGNANDYSGHNNNGTVYGATLTTDRNGVPNSAYQFDGISNFIDVPTLTNKLTGGEFSISFWGYTDVTVPGFAFLLTTDDPSNRFCISIYYPLHNSAPPLNTIFDYGDIANNGRLNSYTSPPINVWSHFTLVCSKNQQKMRYYLNGVLTDSAYFNSDITPIAGRTLQIGGGYGSNGDPYFFQGKLDDIKMFNRAINNKEVVELYHDSLNCEPVVVSGIANQESVNSGNIKIYPSPATDRLHLDVSKVDMEKIIVYNQMGERILERTNLLNDIDVSGWTTGMYIVCFVNKAGTFETRRFIVAH